MQIQKKKLHKYHKHTKNLQKQTNLHQSTDVNRLFMGEAQNDMHRLHILIWTSDGELSIGPNELRQKLLFQCGCWKAHLTHLVISFLFLCVCVFCGILVCLLMCCSVLFLDYCVFFGVFWLVQGVCLCFLVAWCFCMFW